MLSNMIKKLNLQTHVTALCIVQPRFLLEGCGSCLNLYDLKSNELLESVDVFRGARIHGIRYSSDTKRAIVFGGKLLAIASLECSEKSENANRIIITQRLSEIDWIRDASFVDNGDSLVRLTSHNKVLIRKESVSEDIEIQGEENCILYCGKILGQDLSQLTILAGTVFGNILVWTTSTSGEQHLLHRLSGHNGVIFSLNYDEISRTIISTSDDRSVRTWSVDAAELTAVDVNEGLWSLFRRAKINPKYELYGHEARVWNSVVIRQSEADPGLIASLGEDSKICLWSLTTGTLFSKIDAHPGTSVWAADWNPLEKILVTAGGDGSTRIWNTNHLQETSCRQLKLSDDGHIPRLVVVTASGYLVSSQQGIIYGWNSQTQLWMSLFSDERLGNGSVCDSDGQTIIFGTRTGAVMVFSSSPGPSLQLTLTHQFDGPKVYSVHLLGPKKYIACLENGRLLLVNLQHESKPSARFTLPESKQRWPSCALLTNREHLMLGDREGSLHFYKLDTEKPLVSFPHIHGKNGLTDIKADVLNGDLYYTSGRDGRVGLWRVSHESLELLSITNTSLGWIARLRFIDHQLIYLAFHSDRFVVWSSEQQRSLMHVPCGGGHRSWDFDVSSSEVTLVFIKDKHIYENRRPLNGVFSASLPGRCGGHSKSICRGRFICLQEPLILTGSEDTTMRLSRLDQRSFQSLTIITKHVSSVRALAVKELSDSNAGTWLCASAGGRAQLSVGLLTVSRHDDQLHIIHRDVRSHFLRGWLRRASSKPWQHDDQLVPDPETRYMDLDLVDRGGGEFHIIAACSDSFIRIFELALDESRLDLFQELSFHNCCVLQVKVMRARDGNWILLSAGTDGRLAFWNVTSLAEDQSMEPMGCITVHQSGMNSLDCKWLDQDRLLILSGGDDNALICSKIEIDCSKGTFQLVDQQKYFPHAAQISGVALLDDHLCLSVSLDQRLILWKLEDTLMTWLCTVCCDVADIQGLDVWPAAASTHTLVSVYGQGIQVFQLDRGTDINCEYSLHRKTVAPLAH